MRMKVQFFGDRIILGQFVSGVVKRFFKHADADAEYRVIFKNRDR